MKRFIATAAIAAIAVTAVFAQGQVKLASPNGYNDGTYQVIWDGPNYNVYAPLGQDVIIPLHIYVFSKGSPDWNAWTIDLIYNDLRMDVGAYNQNGDLVWFSEVHGTFTALQIATSPIGVNALSAGQVINPDLHDGTTNLQLTIAAGGSNRFRFSDHPSWSPTPHNFYATVDPNDNYVPLLLKLKASYVQPGQTFSFTPGPATTGGISFISRGTRPPGSNLVAGTWVIVPEPASMIALGSGLVGLLALRRRKK